MQRFFAITPPSVHQVVLTLERQGFISRTLKPRSKLRSGLSFPRRLLSIIPFLGTAFLRAGEIGCSCWRWSVRLKKRIGANRGREKRNITQAPLAINFMDMDVPSSRRFQNRECALFSVCIRYADP